MDNTLKVVGGVGLGAGLLFLLDPAAARRLRRGPGGVEQEWTPAARLLAGAAGGGLALYGATRRGPLGAAVGSLGLGLLLRGLTDVPLHRLAGLGSAGPVREVRRAIHVDAPVARVFALWVDYENLPRVLTRLREVREAGDGRSEWLVEGPSGEPAPWDVVLTRFETERELAWRTLGDAERAQELRVLFTPDVEGGTRVEAQLSCNPPAGGDGEDVATLFGADPQRQLERDLVRMKAYVETEFPGPDAGRETT